MDELLSEFLIESQKRLAALDTQLSGFPREPGNSSIQKQIRDFLHTIKGASVLLGLRRLEAVAQAAEQVLVAARTKSIVLSSEHAALMLEAIDAIRRIQRAVATAGQEPTGDDATLIADLKAVAAGKPMARTKVEPEPKPQLQPTPPAPIPEASAEKPAPPAVRRAPAVPSVSIPIERLAHISGLVGELVATRNSVSYVLRERLDPELEEPFQRLDHVTSDLSAAILAARRQALGEAALELQDSFEIQRVISIECGGQHFAIPQRSVLELVRLVPGARRIASDEVRLLRLRERKHPWIRLASLLRIAEPPKSPGTREIVFMMDGAEGPFGLAVDRVYDAEEVVVRPLAPVLRRSPLLAGTTVLGNGSVALVLDSGAMAREVARERIAADPEPARKQLEVRS